MESSALSFNFIALHRASNLSVISEASFYASSTNQSARLSTSSSSFSPRDGGLFNGLFSSMRRSSDFAASSSSDRQSSPNNLAFGRASNDTGTFRSASINIEAGNEGAGLRSGSLEAGNETGTGRLRSGSSAGAGREVAGFV